jgi:CRP/FNR family transcriptional regulator, cyclic AMP receptor protein
MSHTSQIQALENGFDPRDFLARAGGGKTIERYAKNQKIFSQGEVADTVFFIQKGKVKLTVLSELGKEAVVGIFAEGHFFGEGCLSGAELRAATSHAMEECLITSITKKRCLRPWKASRSFPHFS